MLKDGCWGSGGKRFASYSEGVVDTLCGYVEGVDKFFDHPIQTTCNAVGQLITDPAKPIREMSVNMALAIHNRDWDSVAYQVGGLTTHTAVIGTTYAATSGIPSSINVKIPKVSTAALTNGRTALVVSTATARVSTAGAVSIGKAAAGVNIMYAKPSKKSGKERATDIPSWAKGEKPLDGESGKDFAKRLCDEKFGPGNYNTGPGSDYSKLKKMEIVVTKGDD